MAKRVFGAATTRDVTELVERYFDLPCTSDLGLFDQVFHGQAQYDLPTGGRSDEG
ncbi:MAG: hypothetical protein ACM3JK_05050 [Betaproteobacteria bacterium]